MTPRPPRAPWLSSALLPAVVFGLGLSVSAATGVWLWDNIESHVQAEFERSTERVADEVSRRFRQPIYGMHGARGVYAASREVTRAEFRAYVESRDLAREFPGVRGFGFIERVARDQLDTFVATERADGEPQFAVRALQTRGLDDLYVIKYIEPAARNLGASGLDVGSEAVRRRAAEHAVETGLPTLSGVVALVQDSLRSPGFQLYVPVYRNGTNPVTPPQRRAALTGLLFAPIVAGELLDGIADVATGQVSFELIDAKDVTASNPLVFDSIAHAAAQAGAVTNAPHASRFETLRSVALPGRDATLRIRSTPLFDSSFNGSPAWLLFVAGSLASALLAGLLRLQATGLRRAERLAREMTLDLDRLAQVVKRTSNSVTITDRDLRINWINEGFTRVSGYALDDALGKTPGELLGSGKAEPAVLKALADSAAAGTPCRVELLNRAKDGREYWIDTEIQPLRDAQGQLAGFMEIGSDVTERHLSQTRLEAALRDNDALLRTINMQAIVSVADRAGRIIEANDAFCRISGYEREELLGQTHHIVNSGVQPAAFWVEMWRTIASGAPWRGAVCNRAKNGSMYWVDTFIAPFMDAEGRIEKYISIRTDITASKGAERELTRGRQRLANIIEGTNAGTWEWNIETGETVLNDRWAQMIGHERADMGRTTIDMWRDLAHPDDLPRSKALLKRHFSGELPDYECEARMRHKDGHWVWVLTRGKLFGRTKDGAPRWMAGTHMDITERKQAEAALRASQAFLDKTGRIGGVGGWALDLTTQTILWSDQTCRLHDVEIGHRPTLEEAIGFYAPEARPVLQQAVAACIAGGSGWDLELPFVTAKGRCIWVRAVGEAECVDGKPVRLLGAFQDITARRAMEAELRRNNGVMTSVLDNLPCGLSVFDAELNLVASNREFRRLLDLPDRLFEAPSTRFEDIIRYNAARGEYGPGDPEATVKAIVDRARTPSPQHQFERVRPDGTPLEIRGAPMPMGGFVTTYTDISARRQAEAEVQRSAQLLRGAIDAIDEAFVLYDPDDRLVFCNDKYRSVYALSSDLLVPGAPFGEIVRRGAERGQIPAAIGRVDDWVAERLAAHRAGTSTQVQGLDGGRSLRVIDRRMADGHTVGFRVDITEMVRATEAAQAASKSKSQFLANMSHEIRTPMNAILGMLALLRKTDLSTRQADYASKTEGAARSLLGLLNDILDFSKVEAGKMELDPHPFRIDQLMRDLSVILSANIGPKPVEVLFDIDPALPRHLVGDAMRLQQVLINLGGNAIKFTTEGEVVVAVVVVARDAMTVTVEVSVRDTGIGIAPENQARIFSGFTQAEASTTRRYGGSGLGVAISQRLVGLMGGELRLDSALGEGSRFHFRITLPVASAALGDEPAQAAPNPSSPPLRALVVDDNPTAREVMQRMGESLGWAVDLADSGEQALRRLQAQGVDAVAYQAVFVDWQMPGLDGWETSRRIQQLGLAGTPPVVVMVTAHGREMLAQRNEAEQGLLDGFLVKPVTASMLFDAIVDARAGHALPHPSRRVAGAGAKRLAGLRLLVAEDNLNNQQVVRELLEDEGALVQIAQHGKEAVEAVAAADPPFDVVLMDLQMPVMDGFSATRRIRQDLGQARLPIVAMTANAMASDREACLAAGMNDHVGKPFDLNHLVRVLLQHAGRQPLAETRAAPAAPALAAPVSEAAAAAGVDIGAALNRLGGHMGVYRRMLRSFVTDLAAMPQQLQAHLVRGETLPATHLLHTLKGLAATLGAMALSAEAARGENLLLLEPALSEASAVAQQACMAMAAAGPGLAALLVALQGAQAPAAAAASAEFDAQALATALQVLALLLDNGDMAATDTMAALQRDFGGALGERLQPLDDAVGALDFERALRLCHELIEVQPA